MGLGQYNSLGEYCGPHTASSVFLILVLLMISESTYEVAVLTGDLPRAETEAGVYCTLVGSWGDTGRCVLDQSTQNDNPFRQGQVTVFF